jgi:hypothetical protein
MLTFDDPAAGMTIKFAPETFEGRFSRFFDLEK